MKTRFRNLIVAGTFGLFASGLFGAPAGDNGIEQWHKAKTGRNLPKEEARLKAERESSAYREVPSPAATGASWNDERFRMKTGRSTPAEEKRVQAERDSSAFREDPAPKAPKGHWFEDWMRVKTGRTASK